MGKQPENLIANGYGVDLLNYIQSSNLHQKRLAERISRLSNTKYELISETVRLIFETVIADFGHSNVSISDILSYLRGTKTAHKYIPSLLIWLSTFHPDEAREYFKSIKQLYVEPPIIPGLSELPTPWITDVSGPKPDLGLVIPKRLDRPNNSRASEIKYSQQRTEFIGRDDQIKKLHEFMSAEKREENGDFYWWQIAGSAGQGKSRLALEFVREYKDGHGWETGFVGTFDERFVNRLADHKPNRNLLIIVDYIAAPERVKRLKTVIDEFATLSAQYTGYKFRLLVIERQPYDGLNQLQTDDHLKYMPSAWQRFLFTSGDTGHQNILDHVYNRDGSLLLDTPSDDELRTIAKSWVKNVQKTDLTDKQLAEVDRFLGLSSEILETEEEAKKSGQPFRHRALRPLFAILAVEAALRGETASDSDGQVGFELLLKVTLDDDARQMFRKKPNDLLMRDEILDDATTIEQQNLAYLTNIVKSLDARQLAKEDQNGQINFPTIKKDIEQARRILGYAVPVTSIDTNWLMNAREPDLLAEYQFIKACDEACVFEEGHASNSGGEERFKALIEKAWETDVIETFSFLNRLIEDFPDHDSTFVLLKFFPDGKIAQHLWLGLVMNATAFLPYRKSTKLYTVLKAVVTALDDTASRELQAHVAFNLVNANIQAGEIVATQDLYVELETLALAYSRPVFRELQAKAAFNLIDAHINAGELEAAKELYAELKKLTITHDETVPKEQQTKAAVNLMNEYINIADLNSAQELYAELKAFASTHDEAIFREGQAKAASNLITFYIGVGEKETAQGPYAELKALTAANDLPVIRRLYATACFNLITVYINAEMKDYVQSFYVELKALVAANDEAVLRELQAMATYNLINIYINTENFIEAQELYAELKALAATHDEALLRELQATACFNMITVYVIAGALKTTQNLYSELETLTVTHDEAVLRKFLTKAAVCLIGCYVNAGEFEAAVALYVELKELVATHDEATLRERQAKAALNLIKVYVEDGEPEAAQNLYSEMEALSSKYPEEAALQEWLAEAALSLTAYNTEVGDLGLYGELGMLTLDHIKEASLRQQQAEETTSLIIKYIEVEKPTSARKAYYKLRELASGYPEELQLQKWLAWAAYNLIVNYSNGTDLTFVHARYGDLRTLASKHLEEASLRVLQAAGALCLTIYHIVAQNLTSAQELYGEIRALAQAHDEAALREQQGKVAFALFVHYCDAGDHEAARGLYDEIKALALAHDEAALWEQQVEAAFNLIIDYENTGDIEAAQGLYGELKALAQAHDEVALNVLVQTSSDSRCDPGGLQG